MYFEPVLLYTCPLIIAISSWWVDLETDTFLRDPTTPAAPKFCLREKSSCRENSKRKEWEKKMTEIPSTVFRDRRLYSRCSLRVLMPVPPRPSPLDNYKWDCLWDSAKIKKKKKRRSAMSYTFWLRGTSCPKLLARKAKFLSGFWLSMPHCAVFQWDYLA